MTTGHAPTEMLADYASGALSQGMSLIVAAHLTYCCACRGKAERLEVLGGALLSEGAGVDPAPQCLGKALARLDAPDRAGGAPRQRATPLPRPLCRLLAGPIADLPWRTLSPGLEACALDGFPDERVELVRARPGVRVPHHGHTGPEATLVLAGQLRDGADSYRCGDLALADAGVEHEPEAVGSEPCLCLVVLPAGTRLTGALGGGPDP